VPARAPSAFPAAGLAGRLAGVAPLVGAAALFVVVLVAGALLAGCSQPPAIPGGTGDVLVPGAAVVIDLDGDGTGERVLLEKSTRRITITDGPVVYQSREKWQVVEACLGDADGSGLPEVVALLDGSDGRHLGLFAYVGGEYRERLVTSVLLPRPLSLRIVAGNGADAGNTGRGAGDLVVLTEETAGGEAATQTTTYRWNGFGFTAVDAGTSQ
jgi:hypothetical protein